MQQKVIIVGGGFGGIRTALDLAKKQGFEITLISKSSYFEYYPGLHKLLGISEHVTVRIPLETIFKKTAVRLVIETVTGIHLDEKRVTTSQGDYRADFLVLGLGSQTEYFGIPGLVENAYAFKSVDEAQKLRRHIEHLFEKNSTTQKNEAVVGLHMIIVGAGPNGVDLAGEIASLSKDLAKKYGITESLVTLDLVESGPRILGMMSPTVSRRVEQRLRSLGVTILCNRELHRDESWTVTMADMQVGARTLIWTAGITTHELVTQIQDIQLGKKNRVLVDSHLQPKKSSGDGVYTDVFCIGDMADTTYAGLAQTALADGAYVAQLIAREYSGKQAQDYSPQPVAYNIGVGYRWSVLVLGRYEFFGWLPYVLRTVIDIKFFMSILPLREVWNLYTQKKQY